MVLDFSVVTQEIPIGVPILRLAAFILQESWSSKNPFVFFQRALAEYYYSGYSVIYHTLASQTSPLTSKDC